MDAGGASDEGACLRTVKSCGSDASTLAFKFLRSKLLRDDGDKKARSPGRARRKPLKPLRGECRVISGVTVVTNARVYYPPRAAAGAPGARHSPRPLIFQKAEFLAQLGRTVSREREVVSWKKSRLGSRVLTVCKRLAFWLFEIRICNSFGWCAS